MGAFSETPEQNLKMRTIFRKISIFKLSNKIWKLEKNWKQDQFLNMLIFLEFDGSFCKYFFKTFLKIAKRRAEKIAKRKKIPPGRSEMGLRAVRTPPNPPHVCLWFVGEIASGPPRGPIQVGVGWLPRSGQLWEVYGLPWRCPKEPNPKQMVKNNYAIFRSKTFPCLFEPVAYMESRKNDLRGFYGMSNVLHVTGSSYGGST